MVGLVEGYGAVEFVLADEAPGAYGVRSDRDVEVGHDADRWTESHVVVELWSRDVEQLGGR